MRRLRRLLLAVTTIFTVGISFSSNASALTYTNVWNYHSGSCMVVQGTANLAKAFQYVCSGYLDQYWARDYVSSTVFRLVNLNSGMCLAARGYANGTQAVQVVCASYADQYWYSNFDYANGGMQLRNSNSGLCLAVQGYANGNPVFQTPCNPSYLDQEWILN
jgi:hypothetical protein